MNTNSTAFPTDAGTMTAITEPAGEKDDVYYWPDNITFSVDGKLFRVSRYQFIVGSEHFSATYGLTKDKDVVQLEGIAHAQFRTFLKILFPIHSISTTSSFTKEEWLTILELSVQWHFHEFRKLAITHLQGQLNELELIKVGRAAFVPHWVLSGYLSLVKRPGVISLDEADDIGNRTANILWIVRHRVACNFGTACELRADFEEIAGLEAKEYEHRTKGDVEQEAEDARKLEEERKKEMDAMLEMEEEIKREAEERAELEREELARLEQEELMAWNAEENARLEIEALERMQEEEAEEVLRLRVEEKAKLESEERAKLALLEGGEHGNAWLPKEDIEQIDTYRGLEMMAAGGIAQIEALFTLESTAEDAKSQKEPKYPEAEAAVVDTLETEVQSGSDEVSERMVEAVVQESLENAELTEGLPQPDIPVQKVKKASLKKKGKTEDVPSKDKKKKKGKTEDVPLKDKNKKKKAWKLMEPEKPAAGRAQELEQHNQISNGQHSGFKSAEFVV
ncbi:hypothetical protein D9611_003707 [Ephemerocybe angulata]|uniref:BTB domain-containing protein n=1 Tax=Ephemerocybe angulata TaxID=980116 RepID=A0A8H5EYX3_9AGAR|nr:hypothetical protein D9611_003707 [Tulosesus angulatus]